jgi:hypothetical protein
MTPRTLPCLLRWPIQAAKRRVQPGYCTQVNRREPEARSGLRRHLAPQASSVFFAC